MKKSNYKHFHLTSDSRLFFPRPDPPSSMFLSPCRLDALTLTGVLWGESNAVESQRWGSGRAGEAFKGVVSPLSSGPPTSYNRDKLQNKESHLSTLDCHTTKHWMKGNNSQLPTCILNLNVSCNSFSKEVAAISQGGELIS